MLRVDLASIDDDRKFGITYEDDNLEEKIQGSFKSLEVLYHRLCQIIRENADNLNIDEGGTICLESKEEEGRGDLDPLVKM